MVFLHVTKDRQLQSYKNKHAAIHNTDTQSYTWLESRFSCNENLQRKQNWTAKSTNFKENTGKVKSVFAIRAALWAEKFGCCLENCSKWKNTLGKLAVVVNLEAIRFEFWMKGALVTIKICVLCGWWFSNQSEVVSETPFSRNTVGREL